MDRHVRGAARLTVAAGLLLAACGSSDDPTALTVPDAPATDAVGDTATTPPSTAPSNSSNTTTSGGPDSPDPTEPLVGNLTVRIVAEFPHDPTAYTQGLEWLDDVLVESTGRYGASDRRIVDPDDGSILDRDELRADWFGEGLTFAGDLGWQLTWQAGIAVAFDPDTLDEIATATYEGQGWGLCHDGQRLVMSDGSATLTFRDPSTFEWLGSVDVTLADEPIDRLNELECVADQVVANVYGRDSIVVIDPADGRVVATIDATSLRPDGLPIDDLDYALNGIAHDPSDGHWWITGKWWPVIYEVELVPV